MNSTRTEPASLAKLRQAVQEEAEAEKHIAPMLHELLLKTTRCAYARQI